MKAKVIGAVAAVLVCLYVSFPALGLTIQFNYDYDTLDFFNSAVNPNATQARATLEKAGQNYEMFIDSLLPIAPGGGNTWSAVFTNPATGSAVSLPGLVVPADTLIVFVGARDLGSATLGAGGAGGYSALGTQDWINTVFARGQAGALMNPKQDFGPWGGSIAFDIDAVWNYDLASGPSNDSQNDFYSTCLHNMAHVLGFGVSGSWSRLVNSTNHTFLGPVSQSLYDGPVPLSGSSHWDFGTQGLSGGQVQEAAMDPSLTIGTRKLLTDLDVAGLVDVGWQTPEPATLSLLALLALSLPKRGGLALLRSPRRPAAGKL